MMMVSVASIVVVCVESTCVVTFLHKEFHHTLPTVCPTETQVGGEATVAELT